MLENTYIHVTPSHPHPYGCRGVLGHTSFFFSDYNPYFSIICNMSPLLTPTPMSLTKLRRWIQYFTLFLVAMWLSDCQHFLFWFNILYFFNNIITQILEEVYKHVSLNFQPFSLLTNFDISTDFIIMMHHKVTEATQKGRICKCQHPLIRSGNT